MTDKGMPPAGRCLSILLATVILAAGLFVAMPVFAEGPTADDINSIAENLSCPTCTGISVADCPTETCAQWRAEIGVRLSKGQTEQEIMSYFAARYGDHVLQVPPKRGFFLWIWLLPIFAILAGLVVLAFLMRGWLKPSTESPAQATNQPVEDEYLKQVQEDLDRGTE